MKKYLLFFLIFSLAIWPNLATGVSLSSFLGLDNFLSNLASQMKKQVEDFALNNSEDLRQRFLLDETSATQQSGLPILCAEIQAQTAGQTSGGNNAGGGNFVPVNESGQVLSLTQSINNLQGIMRNVIVEICKSNRSINRIQKDAQERQFVTDPNAVASETAKTEQLLAEQDKFIKTGRQLTPGGSETGPLYAENYQEYLAQAQEEAYQLALNDIKNSGNIWADDIIRSFELGRLGGLLTSTVGSKEELYNQTNSTVSTGLEQSVAKNFKTDDPKPRGGIITKLVAGLFNIVSSPDKNRATAEDASEQDIANWQKSFYAWFRTENNPIESQLVAKAYIYQQLNTARQAAEAEYQAGQGYLNNRVCKGQVTNLANGQQLCEKWKTVTPATIVRENAAQAMNYRLNRVSNIQGSNQIVPFSRPLVESLVTNLPLLFRQDNDSGSDDNGNTPLPEIGNAPVLTLNLETPSMTELAGGAANTAKISWSAPGANSCAATNNWYGANADRTQTVLLRASGQNLESSGELSVTLPLSFSVSASRARGDITEDLTVTNDKSNTVTQTSQITVLDNNQAGDVYKVTFQTAAGPITLETTLSTTAAGSAESAAQAIVQSLNSNQTYRDELNKYEIKRDTAETSKVVISSRPAAYNLRCLNTFGADSDSVTIIR